MNQKYCRQISENQDIDGDTKNRLIYQGYACFDELKEDMNKIAAMCIATHIMEMTRLLPAQNKLLLETYLDNIVLRRYQKDQNDGHLKLLLEYKSKNIDMLNVKKVSGLNFSENDEKWLKNLYKKTKDTGFRQFYDNMLENAIFQGKRLKERSESEYIGTKDDTFDFFEQSLDAFKNMNFYNLLHWTYEGEQKQI